MNFNSKIMRKICCTEYNVNETVTAQMHKHLYIRTDDYTHHTDTNIDHT